MFFDKLILDNVIARSDQRERRGYNPKSSRGVTIPSEVEEQSH